MTRCIPIISLIIAATHSAEAQSCIRGAVIDPNKMPVANANVTLLNANDSSEIANVVANEQGVYIFNNLPIGDYSVKAIAIGFVPAHSARISVVSSEDEIDAGVLIMKTMQLNQVIVRANKPVIEQSRQHNDKREEQYNLCGHNCTQCAGNITRNSCKPANDFDSMVISILAGCFVVILAKTTNPA